MSKDFAHLHVHTEFSLSDGIIRVDKLMDHLKQNGMSSCAITDHGNLSGTIAFYKAAKKAGIKPILGCEAYLTYDEDGLDNSDKTRDNYHLVLLAQNNEGWRNLLWLISNAALNNFYHKPRVSFRNLCAKNDGLIALSACLATPVLADSRFEDGKLIPHGDLPQETLKTFKKLFGDRFYAEIQDHPFPEQESYNEFLIGAARGLDIPLVITTDAHFLKEEDYGLHQHVVSKFKWTDAYNKGNCIRSGKDMLASASKWNWEQAFWNTLEIAERCNVELKLGEYENPHINIKECDDYEDFLKWRELKK